MANNEEDPGRWSRYNKMVEARDPIDFNSPYTCKKCGRLKGNHLSDFGLRQNPYACKFEKK